MIPLRIRLSDALARLGFALLRLACAVNPPQPQRATGCSIYQACNACPACADDRRFAEQCARSGRVYEPVRSPGAGR